MGEISILCMSAYGRTWIYGIFNSFVVLFFDAGRPPISRGPAPLTYSCIYFSSYSVPSLLAGLPVSFQSVSSMTMLLLCVSFLKSYISIIYIILYRYMCALLYFSFARGASKTLTLVFKGFFFPPTNPNLTVQ